MTLHALVAYGLVLVGVMSRLAPHPANVTPVIAVALFSGAILPRRAAVFVPLVAVILSDWLIGYDPQLPWNWLAVGCVTGIGWALRQRRSVLRVGGAALSGSTLFFLVSNFGVWLAGQLYPLTREGLLSCYLAGLPFYRNMLLGDLLYTGAFFGGYALLQRYALSPATAVSLPPPRDG